MIRRFWVSQHSRYNKETKQIEFYYKTDVSLKHEDSNTVFEMEIPDETRKEIMKLLLPCLKDSMEGLVDEINKDLYE